MLLERRCGEALGIEHRFGRLLGDVTPQTVTYLVLHGFIHSGSPSECCLIPVDHPQSRGKRLVRASGLTFIYNLHHKIKHKGRLLRGLKKTALRKDFWAATLSRLIHFLPVGAAFVLIIINWRGYYIGGDLAGAAGEDNAKFIGLQFAAKEHELFISASLTAVIFSYIRHELVNKSGFPFRAIPAGLHFNNIS